MTTAKQTPEERETKQNAAEENHSKQKSNVKVSDEVKTLLVQIGGTILMALAIIFFLTPIMGPDGEQFTDGITQVAAVGVIVWLLVRFYTPPSLRDRANQKVHHKLFFSGTSLLTLVLTLAGLLSALFVYFQHQNLFQALGLIVSVVWVAVFLRYFMWSVYHYNINYGLTDEDWRKIEEARQLKKAGYPVSDKDLEAPDKNPYRSQTFGLPPGTVRGMIAFTLLLGGLSLLIVSFGNEYYTGDQLALIRQQFEFFETAFLMMIAFYFGDKSLKYLQNRWNRDTTPAKTDDGTEKAPQPPLTYDVDIDNWDFDLQNALQDREAGITNETTITTAREQLSTQALSVPSEKALGGFVQLQDNLHDKILNDEKIEKQIALLFQEEQIELSMPVVKAVIEVESSGRGHLLNGKPKILLEGHRLWRLIRLKMEKEKKSEKEIQRHLEKMQERHPSIIYPHWTTKHYLWGEREYERLEEARKLEPEYALYATSWGLFQMLGENIEHNLSSRMDKNAGPDSVKYADIHDFENKQYKSEYYHFLDFLAFIKHKRVRGIRLIDFISEKNHGNYDWDSFAYGYNGSGYRRNRYDVKLQNAYEKYRKQYTTTRTRTTTGFMPIIDAGHGGMTNGEYNTSGKQYAFDDGTIIYEGVINRQIGRKLIDMLREANIPYYNLTVNEEKDITLDERVSKANQLYMHNHNYYFLSLHSNASSHETEGEGGTAHGFEVWTSTGQTKSDDLATISAKWYEKEFPEFRFRKDMSDGDPDKEKEHQRNTFKVLRNTLGPAILIENLFYDNPEEAKFLLSPDGQRRIARCLFLIVQEIHQKFRA